MILHIMLLPTSGRVALLSLGSYQWKPSWITPHIVTENIQHFPKNIEQNKLQILWDTMQASAQPGAVSAMGKIIPLIHLKWLLYLVLQHTLLVTSEKYFLFRHTLGTFVWLIHFHVFREITMLLLGGIYDKYQNSILPGTPLLIDILSDGAWIINRSHHSLCHNYRFVL